MSILSLRDISLSLKSGPLFERAGLEIEDRDRIGLIGRNGVGKTSLLSVLVGRLRPDAGEIARTRDFSYSYLPQKIEVPDGCTLRDFLYFGDATEIESVRMSAEGADKGSPHAGHEGSRGGGSRGSHEGAPVISLENRYRALCRELGLSDLDISMRDFSGGELRKAALARALAPYARLLVLDEPTNHLDLRTIEWLEYKLLNLEGAFILVTHDRWFLDAVTSSIVEIDRHTLRSYSGSYSKFLEDKATWLTSLNRMENKRLANLKIELEWLNRGARARATKSERRKREIEKMRESLLERDREKIVFSSNATRLGKKVCVMRGLGLSYGERRLFGDFSWELATGAKVGIVGPNGSGKTSLLRLIAGKLAPSAGSVELGQTVRLSVFEQTNDAIDGAMSMLDFIREHAEHFSIPGAPDLDAESLLERFGFTRTDQGQRLGTLSGGELRRLMLVRTLSESPNLLLLDEPTNDLDIETIESLEAYCADFSGSILMVSHDRLLVDRLADELLIFDGMGSIDRFHGSYFEWKLEEDEESEERGAKARSAKDAGSAADAGSAGRTGSGPAPRAATASASLPDAGAPRKLSFKERKELAELLAGIDELEAEKRALDAFFHDPASPASPRLDFADAGRRYEEIERLLGEKLERWEELAARE